MKTVAFYQPFLNERGTSVAMFDYAYFNQTILGNKSVIIYDHNNSWNVSKGEQRFKETFETHSIDCNNCDMPTVNRKLDEVVEKVGAKWIYMTKIEKKNDGCVSSKAKTLVQCIGMANEPHGDVYSYGSYWLSRACSGGKYPAVPYMVYLPDENGDMREELGIPKTAIVYGRHGGADTFDMPWTYQVIAEVLKQNDNIYFLFLNTTKFMDHPRVIHLDTIVDNNHKTKFINTCDAMLHVRFIGESFGLACGEFSIRNKPVITWFNSKERNHIEILGEKGIYYHNPNELFFILINFKPRPDIDWNCYREYTPEKIMKIFDEVYLK
jgi:hypothetical protein